MPVYHPHLLGDGATCFLDDSSLDHRTDDHAVLGGVVFNRSGREAFDEHWTDLMHRFGVEQPFHMRELGRGRRLSYITGCRRWCLLAEVTAAIKYFKLYTITMSLNNRDHEQRFIAPLQRAMRGYRLAFMAVVVGNANAAPHSKFSGNFDYVLDKGTRYFEQVEETHGALLRLDEQHKYRVGSLVSENDIFSTHLQAADVVAWTKRRLTAGKPLVEDFEVLSQVFDDSHTEAAVTPAILQDMNERFSPYITDDGWIEKEPT
jgi:hypothetical protein